MITIVNTGVANIASVLYAFERLGQKIQVSDQADVIQKSSHVILPGVGTASASLVNLKRLQLEDCLRGLTQPVLGICLGMQIMYAHSDEGDVSCLGIFPGSVKKLSPKEALPVPHMGWNQVKRNRESRLLQNIADSSNFYFVHSFRVPSGEEVCATSEYGESVPAVIERGNWMGTQFHPERSGAVGEQLLKNFIRL